MGVDYDARHMDPTRVLCIKQEDFASQEGWNRVRSGQTSAIYQYVRQNGVFLPRDDVEDDDDYLQIVPWIVVQRYDRLWVMERLATAEDPRLDSPWTLGISGHVEEPPTSVVDPIAWNTRKLWHDTVILDRSCRAHLVGAIKDNENQVGKHHLGLLFFIGLQTGVPAMAEGLNLIGSFRRINLLTNHTRELDDWSNWIVASLLDNTLLANLPQDVLHLPGNQPIGDDF